jgi:hypothetical protein
MQINSPRDNIFTIRFVKSNMNESLCFMYLGLREVVHIRMPSLQMFPNHKEQEFKQQVIGCQQYAHWNALGVSTISKVSSSRFSS